MCVQEEGRLKMELGESALATKGKDRNQAKKKRKGKIPPQGGIKKEIGVSSTKRRGT